MAKGHHAEAQQGTIRWCRWIARCPRLVFGIFLSVHLMFLVISGILVATGYNLLPIVFDQLPLEIFDEPMYRRDMAWDYRNEDLNDVNGGSRRKRDLHDTPESEKHPRESGPSTTHYLDLRGELQQQFKNYEASVFNFLETLDINGMDIESGNRRGFMSDSFPQVLEPGEGMVFASMENEPLYHDNNFRKHEFNLNGTSRRHRRAVDEEEEEVQEREYLLESLTLIYEDPNGNVFTKENLRKIAEFEYSLYNMDSYMTNFCRLIKFGRVYNCQPPSSILRFFDGSYSRANDELYDPSFTNISRVLNAAFEDIDTEDALKFFLAEDARLNSTSNTAVSRRTRTSLNFGYPLKQFGQEKDNRGEQRSVWEKWALNNLIPQLMEHVDHGLGGMDFLFMNFSIFWKEVFATVLLDWIYLVGGIAFIFIFMWFQTGSLFVTFFGVFSIMTSFVGANLIYRVVIGYEFFGIFNVLAIFIILGIGADDIFIFSDAWTLSKSQSHDSIEHRLSSVFKRASIAMFVTSLTTMVAFFANSFSPILAIGAFGSYAGLCIFVNYVSVITFFPAVVMVYHKHFEHKLCCCCGGNQHRPGAEDTTHAKDPEYDNAKDQQTERKPICGNMNLAVAGFLGGPFFRFVSHKVYRCIILVLFSGIVGGAIYFCTTIELEGNQFRLFDASNHYEKAKDRISNDFMANSNEPLVDVKVLWGLKPQDMSSCSRLAYDSLHPCLGTSVWDPNFDLNDAGAQLSLLKFCQMLSTMDGEQREKLEIAYTEEGHNNVSCFIEDMAQFYKEEASEPQYPAGLNFSLPITEDKVRSIMEYNPDVYNVGSWQKVTHPFEIALEFWLTHRFTNETIPDKRSKFRRFIGLEKVNKINLAFDEDEEIYEKELKYAAVEITTFTQVRKLGLLNGLPKIALWENFMSTKISELPKQLNEGFQLSGTWTWLNLIQRISMQSIVTCIAGLGLAFLVIFLGTTNILTGLAATFLLACVTICVIAVIPLAGWKFGFLESLNLCLIVGLSVDYIVHLAEGYHMSKHTTRLERVQDTLSHVGISVISGAITTIGAAFFMLFAKLQFFKQFGTFLFATIGFSMFFSMFVFTAAYSMFGPEGYTGSYLKLCKDRKKYKSQDDDRQPKESVERGDHNQGFELHSS